MNEEAKVPAEPNDAMQLIEDIHQAVRRYEERVRKRIEQNPAPLIALHLRGADLPREWTADLNNYRALREIATKMVSMMCEKIEENAKRA